MDIEALKTMSKSKIQKMYKGYLASNKTSQSTISTAASDTFYLWNNKSKEIFWEVLTSDNFENDARKALNEALTEKSTGNVPYLINGYYNNLKAFRDFIYGDDIAEQEKQDIKALKDFMLDIDCLDPLDEWACKTNLFDILKISKVEIRHSNMLAWLLNPNESHGLSDSILRGFVRNIVKSFRDDGAIPRELLIDFKNFIVQREWHHIDIIAYSPEEKFILVIENKINTGEHDNQLKR